jgi:catalase
MAMHNPSTRANYEPNSWASEEGGPREDPVNGFATFPEEVTGVKRRIRPELFADHFSQARQFYVSQTAVEQTHIGDAFVFELSKCERPDIRSRMVAGLRNVDEDLARHVADGLGLPELPEAAAPARPPIEDLAPSPALSILKNGPDSLAGRKLGILVSAGADAEILEALLAAAEKEDVTVELIAATVGGVETSDGSHHEADQQIDGGPSVLYDAVVLLLSAEGAPQLAAKPPAQDFASDAYAHSKFIGFAGGATALLDAAGLSDATDGGLIEIADAAGAASFLTECRALRFWERWA